MDIAIGCPIFEREWILPHWLRNVEEQWPNKDVTLIFAITDGEDNTRQILNEVSNDFKDVIFIDCNDLPAYRGRDQARFYPLVELRNRIFDVLAELQPDFYFSWDSDILLPPDALTRLIADDKTSVGPWVDLNPPGNTAVNCAIRGEKDSFKRPRPIARHFPPDDLYQVAAIFACFLMKPVVWNETYYKWHTGGEDFGWALVMEEKNLDCWMDSRIIGQHFYNRPGIKKLS